MLTHEGEETYKTFFGALATTAIFVLVLILAIQEMTKVWLNEIENLSTETLYWNLDEAGQVGWSERGFNFAIGF